MVMADSTRITLDHAKQRLRDMKTERGNWEALWRQIADYILPRRQKDEYRSAGENLREKMFDSTAERANNRLASVIQSMLTNPSTKWFNIKLDVPELMDDEQVTRWLEANRDLAIDLMNDSNFSQAADELYLDMGGIGTGIMLVEEGRQKPLHFETLPIYECYLAENDEGIVDTLYREYELTVWQMYNKFDEGDLPKSVKEKYANRKFDDKVKILHVIEPRNVTGTRTPSNAREFPWASAYFSIDDNELIYEGGYNSFPAVCPRWRKASGEVYGRGPGIEALADIKTLNEMAYTNLIAAHLAVEPPWDVEEDAYETQLDFSPNALNIRQQNKNPAQPLLKGDGLVVALEMQNTYRKSVNESFFYQQLTLIDNDRMTATEVIQRTEENMRILGPTFGRFQSEFLEPLVRRMLDILANLGMLYAPPGILSGVTGYKIEYESPLARAQKSQELQAIERSLMVLAPLTQLKPDIIDIPKLDDLARDVFVLNGVPKKRLRTTKEVEAIRQERAQQQMMAQALEQAEQAARAAKDASEADTEKGLLGQVLRR